MSKTKAILPKIAYTPPGRVSAAFLRSAAFVRAIMGPFGSGKSTLCVMEILRRAQEQHPGPDGVRRTRWVAIRNTYPELRTTTIPTWHQWIPQSVGRWIDSGPPRHIISLGKLHIEVLFLSLDRPDDVRDLLGLEITGGWINEVREIPKAIVDALSGRVAQARYPPAALGGATWSGIIMDTNPPDSDHWFYRMAEETRPEGWEFFRQPGGLDQGAENLQWLGQNSDSLALPEDAPARLDRGRETYRKMLAGKGDDWVKVYVNGDYGYVQDGKPVWPEYRDSVHCAPSPALPGIPLHVGMDFGLTPAATFGQRLPNGSWRAVGEVATDDMGVERFGRIVAHELATKYAGLPLATATGDPAGDTRGADERTVFDILKGVGVIAKPSPDLTNDFTRRRESVAWYLSRMVDGSPAFTVDPSCKMLRKGLQGAYKFKRVQVIGSERYQDKPDKSIHSHVCEALQYMFLGAGEGATITRPEGVHRQAPRRGLAVADYDMFA